MTRVVPKEMQVIGVIVEGVQIESNTLCPHCGTRIFVISSFTLEEILEQTGNLIKEHMDNTHPSFDYKREGLSGWTTNVTQKNYVHPEPSFMN